MRMKYILSALRICLDVMVQISGTLSDEAALDSCIYQPSDPGLKLPSAWHPQAPIRH